METVISPDGTPIAYRRSGSGPPLVMVHGSGGSSNRWTPVLPGLERHFSVIAMDRRGRGASGDAPGYSLEREVEDAAAVVEALDEPAHLFGHSFGGLVVPEAALLTGRLRRLVVYEAPIPVEGMLIYPPGYIDRMQALVDAGEYENALISLLKDIAGMPDGEIELLRSYPTWPERVAAAPTLARESYAEERYAFEPRRFAELAVPVLLLMGELSPDVLKAGVERLHAALPDSRIVELPGQQHIAMNTAPELFVREVVNFLKAES